MIPWKSGPSPTGISTGITFGVSCRLICSYTRSKPACSLSLKETKNSRGIRRLFFVSLMDKEHAGFERVYEQIKRQLTPKVIPVEIPVGEGPDFHGIINLFSKKCHLYKKGTKAGEYEEVDVPEEYRERFDRYSKELIERIAETDDTLLERYLGGEEIGRDEAIAAMKAGMAHGEYEEVDVP